MFKDWLTFLRISWGLYNNHPDKTFRHSCTVSNTTYYAIYDLDNNQRLTDRLSMRAWRDLSNRQINRMLQVYGT